MLKKKKESPSKPHDPTPYLGKPRPDRKSFTYSENALLDQITTEVMYAWKSDLENIKSHYVKLLDACNQIKNISDFMEEKLPNLDKFLKSNNILTLLEKIEFNSSKISTDYRSISQTMLLIQMELKKLQEKKPKKPLWERIFKN